jgi:hypothetical protein
MLYPAQAARGQQRRALGETAWLRWSERPYAPITLR